MRNAMNRALWKSWVLVIAMGVVLGVHAGCSPDAKTSGETHWLGDCDRDSDCETGEQCLCGVCSRTCSGDGECGGGPAAECFETASRALAQRCGKLPPSGGICLAVCSSSPDCREGNSCFRGACLAGTSSNGAPDSGAPDSGASDGGALDSGSTSMDIAAKYVHVDSGVTFDGPIAPPDPSPLIYLADDSLVGHWAEYGSDGELCTPEHNTDDGASVCMQLEITKDATLGGFVATAYWLHSARVPASASDGPFAPASDPDHGYPTDVTPSEYRNLESHPYPDGRYTVFEGQFVDTTLSFWISRAELWTAWCKLQTPYPFDGPGLKEKGYRCVPQDATAQNTDPGKLTLCTAEPEYDDYKTLCREDADGGINAICYQLWDECWCSAKGCTPMLRSQSTPFSLEVSGTTMVSTLTDVVQAPLELRKVSP
jgi:hypothetical protein